MPAFWRWVGRCSAIGVSVALACVGCGSANNPGQTLTPTATSTALPTSTPLPSAAPTPTAESEGPELRFGSTGPGSGALALENDDDLTVKVFFSACLGGTGPNCDGGFLVYVGSDPGFPAIEEGVPEQPLYVLKDGMQVSLLVTAIDQGVSLMFGDATLDAAGKSAVLGITPLHADGSWQVTVPGGAPPTNRSVTLRLTTTASGYAASAPFTITLVPTEEEGG